MCDKQTPCSTSRLYNNNRHKMYFKIVFKIKVELQFILEDHEAELR